MAFISSHAGHRPGQKEWRCFQILHDGEGDRGLSVRCLTPHYASAEEAAVLAADYFDDAEQHRERNWDNDPFDGAEQVIEVEGAGRFRVRCTVKRAYEVVVR
jgi:hypothetical protein